MGGLPRRKTLIWHFEDYADEQDSIHFATASSWMNDPSLYEDIQEDRMRRRAPKRWGKQRKPTSEEHETLCRIQSAPAPGARRVTGKWFWRGKWRLR